MKKLILLLTLNLIFINSKAQIPEGLTVAGLTNFINTTIDNLTNAGTILEANGSTVVSGALSQVNSMLIQFNAQTKDNITTPINKLSSNIQSLADQLFSMTSRINTILTQQQNCLVVNSQVVLAGIQSVVSGISLLGIPITKQLAKINYFQFEGHSPSLVPNNGGRIDIVGIKLWDSSIPPNVEILSENRNNILANIKPQRGQDVNSFSFVLSQDFINKHSGECLQLQVEPKHKDFLFWSKSYGIYYLPICIPSSFQTSFKLIAHIQYPCDSQYTEILNFVHIHYGNHVCERNLLVDQTINWDIKGGIILNPVIKNVNSVNNNNININAVGSGIHVSGYIDEASCVKTFFSATVQHDATYDADIAPQIQYTTSIPKTSDGSSSFIPINPQTTNLTVDLNKTCDGILNNIFWFEIVKTDGNQSSTIYTSKKISDNQFHDDYNGLSIDALYTGTPVNGKAEVFVKITQAQCGI